MSNNDAENKHSDPSATDQSAPLLPVKFRDAVCAMPECAMGVVKVVVTLKDGSRIPDLYVIGGYLVAKVGTDTSLPFDCADIVKVESQGRFL